VLTGLWLDFGDKRVPGELFVRSARGTNLFRFIVSFFAGAYITLSVVSSTRLTFDCVIMVTSWLTGGTFFGCAANGSYLIVARLSINASSSLSSAKSVISFSKRF